jgi:23S rRNA pseudouridine2604 synthase
MNENPEAIRVSKRLSELGLCSRREADEYIEKGWVLVNGHRAILGQRVTEADKVELNQKLTAAQASLVTVLVHKPIAYVSGQAEDGYRPAIVLVTPDTQWREDRSGKRFSRTHLQHLVPAGRLDIDSTGLLVLTQDGRIAKQLIGESNTVEKEYLVRVTGTLSDADLQRMRHGLTMDGEPLKPAQVAWQNEDQLRIVLQEGKKRQIRRMCEMVGLTVVGLKRIRIGKMMLGNLPVGKWRYLGAGEGF